MQSFKIKCLDNNAQTLGQQEVSFSENSADNHKISFLDKDGNCPFFLDLEANELALDNSNGDFSAITKEKGIALIKIKNVKMDYEENITFTFEGSDVVYKISANNLETKKGSDFVPVKKFDKPLSIILPATLFSDIQNEKLDVNGFPFQMFDVLENNNLGVDTFKSSNKLLNLIKFNNNLFIGRGKKLIPININDQHFYKNGDQSILGFTTGKNIGMGGKQVSGIAFELPENELLEVAKFLNGNTETKFKTKEDYDKNEIGYKMVRKQSDLTKVINKSTKNAVTVQEGEKKDYIKEEMFYDDNKKKSINTTNLTPENNNGKVVSNTSEDDNNNGTAKAKENVSDSSNVTAKESEKASIGNNSKADKVDEKNDSKSVDGKTTSDKKEDKKEDKKPEKKTATITSSIFGVAAAFIGVGLISGVFLSPIAWFLFFFMALLSASGATISIAYDDVKKEKLSKEEKTKQKINKLEKKIDKLIDKNKSDISKDKKLKNERKIENLQNKINTLNSPNASKESKKIKSNEKKSDIKIVEEIKKDVKKATNNNEELNKEEIMPSLDQDLSEEKFEEKNKEITKNPKRTQTPAEKQQEMLEKSKFVHQTLKSATSIPPKSIDEYSNLVTKVNDSISMFTNSEYCNDLGNSEKDFFQSCVNYQNAYIAEESSKNGLEEAKSNKSEELSIYEEDYKTSKVLLNNELNNLFNASEKYIKDRTMLSPIQNNQIEKYQAQDLEK